MHDFRCLWYFVTWVVLIWPSYCYHSLLLISSIHNLWEPWWTIQMDTKLKASFTFLLFLFHEFSGYNLQDLIQEAQYRWLRPGEVFFILQNYEEKQLNHAPPQKPPSNFLPLFMYCFLIFHWSCWFKSVTGGSVFLFNKRVLRFFRKDGHSWRRKKDGKNVGEAHERLKVFFLLLFWL